MNIIIVDDDAFVSASLKIILESYLRPEQMVTTPSPCTILTSPMFC